MWNIGTQLWIFPIASPTIYAPSSMPDTIIQSFPENTTLQTIVSLSVNIFDQEEYLGCLTVFEESRPFRSSDRALAVFFSKLLRQAIQQNPILSSTRTLYDEPCAASFPGSVLILNIVVL